MRRILLTIAVSVSVMCASEFRQFWPIPTMKLHQQNVSLQQYKAPSEEGIAKALKVLFANYQSPSIVGKFLSDDFYDKERLLQNLTYKVPRDARVRITSLRDFQILDQHQEGDRVVSRVSVTATTQIEFNDPQKGFRKIEGENEYILEVYQKNE